jgi:hypothetical protein
MRFARKAHRGAAAALAVAVAALAAGCASGTPASVHTAAVTPGAEAGSAGPVPPVFAVSFAPARASGSGDRLAVLSSRTGALLRWLAPPPKGATDTVLSVRDGWVYFVRSPVGLGPGSGSPGPAIWRVRLAGGRAQLVQTGASGYAVSPDGQAVAYVTGADHGNAVEVAVRNLATGKRNTIILATRPDARANNWPPGVSGLTWAPDDVHLAVQFQLTAAIGSVLVFSAFTATTVAGGRAGPASCTAADYQCAEADPAYLASGVLTYVIQRISRSGATRASLAAWRPGGRARTRLSFPAGTQPQPYEMTAHGQAIWASGPAQPKGPWTIWRWSGGAPVKITTLPALGASPYYGIGAIGW